jgi:hypothetical protein
MNSVAVEIVKRPPPSTLTLKKVKPITNPIIKRKSKKLQVTSLGEGKEARLTQE